MNPSISEAPLNPDRGFDLRGGTVIVTGAGSGIGRALALEFAAAGASVVCVGRRLEPVNETAELIQHQHGAGHALALSVDVTVPKEVTEMVQRANEEFGSIDLLFNNAGRFQAVGPFWEIDPDEWWRDVTVNLRGTALACHAVLPFMCRQRRGVIINMDGGGGGCGPDIVVRRLAPNNAPRFGGANPGGSAYGSSKAALVRFTEGLARELEMEGSPVLVFGMNPGLVRTDMTESLSNDTNGNGMRNTFLHNMFDAKADRSPSDCARATLELLSIAGPDLNGCVFDVDTDFSAVADHRGIVRERDLYVMRLRDPRSDTHLVDTD